MNMKGYSTGLYGWSERRVLDGQIVDWDDIYRECAESGLDAVELDRGHLERIGRVQAHGLQVSAFYISFFLHERDLAPKLKETLLPLAELLAAAKCSDLLINADPKGGWETPEFKNEDELKRQGEHLSLISSLIEPYGMRACMHNHASQRLRAEGDLRSVIEYSAESVGLCVDTGWAHTAECDPIDWIRAYPKRIYATHLRNQKGPIPTEDLMEGDISFLHLVHELQNINYQGWLSLELWHRKDNNPIRTMLEDTKLSLHLLRQCISESNNK